MATVVAMATLRKGWDIGYKAEVVEWLLELSFLPATYGSGLLLPDKGDRSP